MAYTTLAVLKTYLDISSDDDDALLYDLIERAQAAIDTYTGRTFEAAAGVRYYGSDAVDGVWLQLDYDLHSLTSIANGDTSGTAVDTDEVTLWCGGSRNAGPPYDRLRLNANSGDSWKVYTDYWIAVTGTWGYSTSAPSDIQLATLRWASYLYQQKDAPYTRIIADTARGMVELPQDISPDIKALLDPYVRRS